MQGGMLSPGAFGRLLALDGKRLTHLPAVRFSVVIMPDGHGGLWASPYAHWTGSRWQFPQRPQSCLALTGTLQSAQVLSMPGTRTALAPFECGEGPAPVP